MSHDSANLATPDIKWLGVRPTDLDKYAVPKECRLELTPNDVQALTLLPSAYTYTRTLERVETGEGGGER
jgi:DNA topoisomerase VI subunit A